MPIRFSNILTFDKVVEFGQDDKIAGKTTFNFIQSAARRKITDLAKKSGTNLKVRLFGSNATMVMKQNLGAADCAMISADNTVIYYDQHGRMDHDGHIDDLHPLIKETWQKPNMQQDKQRWGLVVSERAVENHPDVTAEQYLKNATQLTSALQKMLAPAPVFELV